MAAEFGVGFEGGTFGGRVGLVGGGEDARGRIGGEDEDFVVAAAGGYQRRVEWMLDYAEDGVCVEIEVRYRIVLELDLFLRLSSIFGVGVHGVIAIISDLFCGFGCVKECLVVF